MSSSPTITPSTALPAAPTGLAERLAEVVDALPDAVLCLNRAWQVTYANAEAVRISRLQPEHFRSKTHWELYPESVGTEVERVYRAAMESRQAASFEHAYEPFGVTLHINILPTDEGLALHYRDITAQRLAEAREREQADRLREALEATSDAVATLDHGWHYTFLNQRAQKLIDPDNRLIGKMIWEEFPHAVGTPAWDAYHKSMDERLPAHAEVFYGAPLNMWLSLRSWPTPDGIVVFFRDITDQKTHDAVVEAQNELLTVVQQAARLATWDIDLETQKCLWGPGSCDVFGHPLSELTTFESLTRIFLESRDSVRGKIDESVRSGAAFVTEFAVRAAAGQTIWIEARGQAVPGADGSRRLRGIAIDVTERKGHEERLVASETRYRVLADLNPQAIWMGDAGGDITYANQGFLAYIGLTPENLTGLGWLEAFSPEDRTRVVEVWGRSVTSGVDYDFEGRLLNAATGEYRYWHLKAAPVRDTAGKILHWLGVGNDIHDAKIHAATLRAEQAETERRRAELETIYKTAPVGLALLDPVEFRFLSLNDQEAEMLGFSKDQILGRPLSEIAPIPGLLDLFRFVAQGNVVKDRLLEGELAAHPGEKRAWSVNYSPIFSEDGSVRAISTASIEITNQKKSEAALIRSEKLAAVGRLASSISHEINNPLEAVTNLLYLIGLDEHLPPELRSYVQLAQSELSRVSQIATQTLRFHRQAVAPTSVNAADLVNAVIRLYTGRLTNSNITLDARYSTSQKIMCFENDIRQVLNNLIANAIDAMRTGGTLAVRAHLAHDARGREGVRITVADTGHGMSKAVVARVFEPFFTTKDLNGTGLGLWISTGIVERHNGRLSVRSSDRPDHHGTVFALFLPRENPAS